MLRTVEFNALVTVGVVLALATGLLTGRYTIAAASGPDDDHVHSAQFCVVGGGPGGLQARPSSAPRRLCFHSFFTPPLDFLFWTTSLSTGHYSLVFFLRAHCTDIPPRLR